MAERRPSKRYLELLELNKQMHETKTGEFNGSSLINVICDIGVLLRQHGCKSVLDYGCGRGDAQRAFRVDALWNVEYRGYDPAAKAFENLPEGKFDAVICTDALEHIPEEDLLDWVLDELFGKANKLVFIKVPTYEVETLLPNGENVHCTVKPKDWWEDIFTRYATKHRVDCVAVIKLKPVGGEKG